MGEYSFIASNVEMPEIEEKVKVITVREAIELGIEAHELAPWEEMDPNDEILLVDDEEDLNELYIKKKRNNDVRRYTRQPHIYEVSFSYSKDRLEALLVYLKDKIKGGQVIELWKVLDVEGRNKTNIKPIMCDRRRLSLNDLEQMYNPNHKAYLEEACLVIR